MHGFVSMMLKEDNLVLVIGLGNPILGDDGVGWRVVEEVERKLGGREVEFEYFSLGGLALMERMVGYQKVLVVDSIVTGAKPLGTVYNLPLSRLPNFSAGHTTASHDASLQTALEVGRSLGCILPAEVWVVAVETGHAYDFTEELSPEIAGAVPHAVEAVMEALSGVFMAGAVGDPI